MFSFFVNDCGDGSFIPTTTGTIALCLIVVLLFVFAVIIYRKQTPEKKKGFTTKQLTYAAVAMAIAMITSAIKLFHLPLGGSITLCSMLFVTLIGYFYGPAFGLLAAFAYGMIQLIANPYIISFWQMLCDYPLAFGALGLSGLMANKKHGLISGYLVGVAGRYVFTVISGAIFFGTYAADFNMSPWPYSLLYNLCYIGGEALITVALLCIPAVRKGIERVKDHALI